MNNSTPLKDTEKKSKFWLGFILFFPLLSVCSGITMIYLASTSENSMVQDDWYKAGLAVNVDLAEEQWAATQQIALNLFIESSNSDNENSALIELTSKNSAASSNTAALPSKAALHGKKLELSFEHVTDDARDIKLELNRDETQDTIVYKGIFDKKLSGTYRIHVKGILDYKPWALTQRFSVPNNDSKKWSINLKASS